MEAIDVRFGYDDEKPHVRLEVLGFEFPDIAEPSGLDLLVCRVHAHAAPVSATFDVSLRVAELMDLREYLREINSGNGPPISFALAGGLLEISFAPSRRGPVLCAVRIKSIDASHVRLEYLVTLEPESISRSIADLAALEAAASE